MKKSPCFVILLATVFAICISNLIFIWRALERELEDIEWHQQRSNQSNGNFVDRQPQQQPSQPQLPFNFTIDLERQHAYDILQDARAVPITPEIISQLPRYSEIVSQYGPAPIFHNLEFCANFRSLIPKRQRYAAVAGLFNTGTNLLSNLMTHNCQIDGRAKGTGMRSQVPWGKHNPPSTHRLLNVARVGGAGVNQTAVFPMVIVKDPYHWAVSQCRHRYFSAWEHDVEHCPNIVSYRNGRPTRVSVKYALGMENYTTLVGLWNAWYGEYEMQQFPMAILRFEDILFHAEEVVAKLCRCVGGRRRNGGKLQYPPENVKKGIAGHSEANGLVEALVRYGNPNKRLEGWTRGDLEYARDHLDGALMTQYGYRPPRGRRSYSLEHMERDGSISSS